MSTQVKAHQEALQLAKDQAKNGQNADLKSLANKAIPTLEDHLRSAQEIQKAVSK